MAFSDPVRHGEQEMKQNEARLLGIAVRPAPGATPQELSEAVIDITTGIAGDHRRTPGARQVTVLTREGWEAACREVDAELPWTTRRANLFIDGVDLSRTRGAQLQIGEVVLEITGETRPCGFMENAQAGLRQALGLDWRGGVTCQVIAGGAVRVGDPVVLAEQEVAA
jgi:MOSC domain-containing protein YiiM